MYKMDIFLYQIQYDDKTAASEDSGLLTFDCREKPEFLKRETAHFIRFYDEVVIHANDDDYFGLLSPKFGDKTGLTSIDVTQFIQDNPNQDIYLFNPFPMLVYMYLNMWVHAENVHLGLLDITDELFKKSNFDFEVSSLHRQNVHQVTYCNCWVAKKTYFDKYISLLKKMDKTIDENQVLRSKIFEFTEYANEKACFYPFIFERVLSTFLYLNPEIKSLPYKYQDKDIVTNRLNRIERKFCLSPLKDTFDEWESQKTVDVEEIRIKLDIMTNFLRPKHSVGLVRSVIKKINLFKFQTLKDNILPSDD